MTQVNPYTADPTLESVPVTVLFTRQRLLTENSSVTAVSATAKAKLDDLTKRATEITAILTEIRGYHRGGLHE